MQNFNSIFGDSWLQGRKLLPILSRLGADIRGPMLDLGCGRSPLRTLFPATEKYIRMDRYAVDSEVIVIDDPMHLPLPDASVDAVLMSRMLGDLPDVCGVLRELARVLRPGGKLLIYEAISFPQHDLPHDYWRVLPAGLIWAAQRAGLVAGEVEYLGGYFTQLAMHTNFFLLSGFERSRLTRGIGRSLRAASNLIWAGLDGIRPRPTLATDYFACIVKPETNNTESNAA